MAKRSQHSSQTRLLTLDGALEASYVVLDVEVCWDTLNSSANAAISKGNLVGHAQEGFMDSP